MQYAALRSASLTTGDPCLQPHELKIFESPTWVVKGELVSELSVHVLKGSTHTTLIYDALIISSADWLC